ncbi:S-adenosyl-methyltransferase mraw, partial [Globisporangium splendens]
MLLRCASAARAQCAATGHRSRRCFASTAATAPEHIPVLLQETVALWGGANSSTNNSRKRYFVDGTTGFGGHSRALLERYDDAQLLCIDRDPEVLAIARTNLRDFHGRVTFQQGSYADIRAHLEAANFPHSVDGIMVDLGANSFHFDQAHRGFSWMHDGPLDMRFDQSNDVIPTAAHVLNTHSEVQLTKIFKEFGEEKLAKEFAKAVVRDREEKGVVFKTTQDLKLCIERIARRWSNDSSKASSSSKDSKKSNAAAATKSKTHPATRCFQALRIYVNQELQHVEEGIHELINCLAPGGRLGALLTKDDMANLLTHLFYLMPATIAFHSLEDRPIKTLFRKLDKQGRQSDDEDEYDDLFGDESDEDGDDGEPVETKRFHLAKRKAIKPTADEMSRNPRSRSARLRCLERIE